MASARKAVSISTCTAVHELIDLSRNSPDFDGPGITAATIAKRFIPPDGVAALAKGVSTQAGAARAREPQRNSIIHLDDDDSDGDNNDVVAVEYKSDPNERQTASTDTTNLLKRRRRQRGVDQTNSDSNHEEILILDDYSHFLEMFPAPSKKRKGELQHTQEVVECIAALNPEYDHFKDEEVEVVSVIPKKTDSPEGGQIEIVSSVPERLPQYQVLDVFPDADMSYVQQLLNACNNNVETAVATMAEKSNYPKSSVQGITSTLVYDETISSSKYDFMSLTSFQPSESYKKEALTQLGIDFPYISAAAIARIMDQNQNHYAICHDKILQCIKTAGNDCNSKQKQTKLPYAAIGTVTDPVNYQESKKEYELVSAAFRGRPLQVHQISAIERLCGTGSRRTSFSLTLKRARQSSPITGRHYTENRNEGNKYETIKDHILREEVKYVVGKLNDWMSTTKTKIDRRQKQQAAQASVTAVECACCFDSYHWDDMVACKKSDDFTYFDTQPHLFCADCIQNMIESQVFSQGNLGYDNDTKELALELKCFHGDGCSFGFDRSSLAKVVPSILMKKYDEIQFRLLIKKAGLDTTVHACPKCGYQCDVPPSQNIFSCPVASCMFESCRLCGEVSHIPLRCDEVVKDRVETACRTTVEEAISTAKIRSCPKCKQQFIKSDGCNKIRCGCGAFVCYVCRKQITGYEHFCQTPHCVHADCGKCPLHTNTEQDDIRAMRDAGIQAVAQQHKEHGTDLRIDVDKMLQNPK